VLCEVSSLTFAMTCVRALMCIDSQRRTKPAGEMIESLSARNVVHQQCARSTTIVGSCDRPTENSVHVHARTCASDHSAASGLTQQGTGHNEPAGLSSGSLRRNMYYQLDTSADGGKQLRRRCTRWAVGRDQDMEIKHLCIGQESTYRNDSWPAVSQI
jgi:hypothetical protein